MLFSNIRAQSGHELDAQGLHQAEKAQDGNEGEDEQPGRMTETLSPTVLPKSQRHHRKAFSRGMGPEPRVPFQDPEA